MNDNIDKIILNKLNKKVQKYVTFLYKFESYVVVLNHPIYGEHSIHCDTLKDLKNECSDFIKDGTIY